MKTIGITTTIPIELLLAAGYQPADLNNVFINDPEPERLVNIAERAGFPLNCCSWIKGIYGVCMEHGIDTVLCVTNGDCSNTIMLMEVLRLKGLRVIPFAYPDEPDTRKMRRSLRALAEALGTTLEAAEGIRDELIPSRELALELDRFTWQEGLVSGLENHLWLVSASDFNRDIPGYNRQLRELLSECRQRKPYPPDWPRLAYIGVPAIYARELYPHIESNQARVVFNETQRQFTMPRPGDSTAAQYCAYTYPYSVFERVRDIKREMKRRRIDGIIHYVQAFCHRGIGDIIFRSTLELPILTLEGHDEFHLTQHLKTRIEAFLDMLSRRRGAVINREVTQWQPESESMALGASEDSP